MGVRGRGRHPRASYNLPLSARLAAYDHRSGAIGNDGDVQFETRAIHAGQDPDPAFGAVAVPIYQTSTFAQRGVGVHSGYAYGRAHNPTRTALEEAIASLEGGRHGLAFPSGMGAVSAVLLALLRPGDHLLLPGDVYGGTYRLIAGVLTRWGITFDQADMTDADAVRAAIRDETRMVWVETPSNPFVRITDIEQVASIAREAGVLCVADNTFATPWLQTPLAMGADLVVHSTTKYLGGHSDVVGGAVVLDDDDRFEAIRSAQTSAGLNPAPFDCFLVLRGVKTLAVRMEAHCRGAAAVAEFLAGHPDVQAVWYPGLPGHPGHGLAARQMRAFGGMLALELASEEQALKMLERLQLFTLGESLGGVESLAGHPASMSHAALEGTPLAVASNIVRLSVGIEHPDDLVEDLAQALS
jgi:cystathionine gamma-synthase